MTEPKETVETLSCARGAVPSPLRLTSWDEGTALSATEREAERCPVAVGAKVTAMEQAEPELSVAFGPLGQLLVSAKSEAFAPVMEMLEIDSGPFPVFCNVTA